MSTQPRLPLATLSLERTPRAARVRQWQQWMDHMVDVTVGARASTAAFQGSLTICEAGGVVLSQCQSDAMRIHRGYDRISRDSFNHYVVHIVLEGGEGRACFDGFEVATRSGDILLLDFDQASTIERTAYRALGLFVPRALLLPHLDPAGPAVRIAARDSVVGAMTRDWARVFVSHLPELTQGEADRAVSGLLPLLGSCFNHGYRTGDDASGPRAGAMRRMIAGFIDENQDNPALDTDMVARHFGLSRSRLYRLFAGAREGPAAIIRRHRLRAALRDVIHRPGIPINEVALAAGFSTPAGFSAAFRRTYGVSPTQARQLPSGAAGRRAGRKASQPYAAALASLPAYFEP